MSRKANVLAFDVQKPIEDKFAALEQQAYEKNHATAGQQAKVPEPKASAPMRSDKSQETSEVRRPDGGQVRGRGVRWTRAKDGAHMRSTTVHLPVELHKALAIHCATEDMKLSEAVVEAVAAYLER